jgi:hypothetical protein
MAINTLKAITKQKTNDRYGELNCHSETYIKIIFCHVPQSQENFQIKYVNKIFYLEYYIKIII